MPFRSGPGGITVRLRVTPRGGADRIEGRGEDADGEPYLKLRVSAVAEKGKANDAVLKLLAKAWRVPRSSLSLLSGETGRIKVVKIEGDAEKLMAHIGASLESP
ncbi:DUF167 family protein [Parvibaculum sp.]|uniref:DUF167 family protein n=1 Tax=Parvibaculum sp. TaxID=2024848 RepID=UPI001B1355B5|nr:DUF167 family protein [Parvibaculum sp.]MBO6668501.1 DUF167 domain-containing protein [Parvibaculum sp.]MBO6693421.1 DUF167 domain-containing protein [Parvibaculum sp.]MBO6714177.1 DUF167 domain-containing protein [Parvibaculum sp.]